MKKIKSIMKVCLFAVGIIYLQQTMAQHAVPQDVLGCGGGEMSNSDYKIIGSLGQPVVGEMSNSSYKNTMGFWYEDVNLRGILGDISGEGLANSTDALIILSYDVGIPIPLEILNRIYIGFGDTNSDDFTNSTDALIILSYDVGMTVPFQVGQLVVPLQYPSPSSNWITTKTIKEGGKIIATAIPENPRNILGEMLNVPVEIDLTNFSEKIGSFTATLEWDTEILKLENFRGGSTSGFEEPILNDTEKEKGRLRFAHAFPKGAEGVVNILNFQFKVVAKYSSKTSLTLNFDAATSAGTFKNLIPYLKISESEIIVSAEDIPQMFEASNYPNPFNPVTHIRYSLPKPAHVKIEVFNVLGQRVKVLVDERKEAGYHMVDFEAGRFASGLYFYRINAGEFQAVKKIMLMK